MINDNRSPCKKFTVVNNAPKPFAMYAMKYLDCGLAPVPCLGEDGKKPQVRWKKYKQSAPSADTIQKWAIKYPESNLGIITGKASEITVVDCDYIGWNLKTLFDMFGETPLVARTPSGGLHLYYKHNGEKNVVKLHNLNIDIRADGGIIIIPPSYNRKTNEVYTFIEGSLNDIQNLPKISNSFYNHKSCHKSSIYNEKQTDGIIAKGERNNQLFLHLKDQALKCNDMHELLNIAHKLVESKMTEKLDDIEINTTVDSVWKLKLTNSIFSKDKQFIEYDIEIMRKLLRISHKAAALYNDLKAHHYNGKEFAITSEQYAKSLGMSLSSLRKVITILKKEGLIKLVRQGGRHKNDPNLYILS